MINQIKKYVPELNYLKWLSFGFIITLLVVQCDINDSTPSVKEENFKLIHKYDINVLEPSGLTFNSDFSALWTVSDDRNHIYKLNLKGVVLNELNFTGNDLEGITYDNSNNTLWVVEEQLREIINVNLDGNELARKKINISGSTNKGFEGICLDTTGTVYLLNEKYPNLWIKLKSDFSVQQKIEINDVGDLSGITYDKKHKVFWIVSDESQLLFQWTPEKGIIKSFNLSITKAEGVAYNIELNRIYIVSDATNQLFVYQLND